MAEQRVRKSDIIAALLGGFAIGTVAIGIWITSGGRDRVVPAAVVSDTAAADEEAIEATTDTVSADVEAPRIGGTIARVDERVQTRLADDPVATAPLRGPLRIRARDVRWMESTGRTFARAPAVSGTLDAGALRGGAILLQDVVMERGEVTLVRPTDDAAWNYEIVLAGILNPADNGSDNGSTRRFQINGLRVRDTRVDVRLPERHMTFEDLDADASRVLLAAPGLVDPELDIANASATLVLHDRDVRLALSAEDGNVRLIENGVAYDVAAVRIDSTRLADVTGVWAGDLPGYGVRATGRALDVRFADIRFIAPERIPEEGMASFTFSIDPQTEGRTRIALTDIDATSGDSRAFGALDAVILAGGFEVTSADLRVDPLSIALIERVLGRELPYDGTLTGTVTGSGGDIGFELDARLTSAGSPTPLFTHLSGAVDFSAGGFALRNLVATLDDAPLAALRAVIPGLPFGGTVSGRIALEGMPGDAPLNLDVRLELAQGVFTVQGIVDLRTEVPSYDVEGTILGLKLNEVFTSFAPPALLTGRFTLDGRGFDPATASARVSLGGRFTGWETGADDVVRARAVVENGTLRVDTLGMRLSTMTFAGTGSWRFVTPQTGAITYELAVEALEPWGPYLPLADSSATGSVRARGTVTGPLEAVRVAGTFSGSGIELGSGWAAQDIEAEYDATFGAPVPRVQLLATARNLGTPTAGSFYVITTSMQLTPPTFALDLSGMRENAAGEAIELVARGNVPYEGAREIVVERAHLDIEEGLWRLSQPATISWSEGDGVRVRDLEFRNEDGEGRLAIDGRLLPLERTDLTVDVARLPAAEVQLLLGREPIVSGDLWASGTVRNLAATPEVDLTFRLDSGAVMDVALARFAGSVDYRDGALVTTAQAAFDTAGTLDIELAVPFNFVVEDSLAFGIGDSGPIRGSITADRVSLVPFEPLFTGLRDLQGWASGALTLAGTIADPQLDGEVRIVEAAAMVPVLNKRYEQINGTLSFAGRQILIDSLTTMAGGTARVAGTITLEELTEPVLDVDIVMTEFQVAGVDNETDAEVTGTVAVNGAIEALTLTGSVRVGDGAVLIPNMAQSTLDEDIFLAPGETFEGPLTDGSSGLVENLRIRDLRVEVHRDTWFVLEGQARTQLGGVLTVNKTGEEWRVAGELEGERGTYTVAAGPIVRQFDITYIRLRFQNDIELNPSIEVIATRTIIDQSGQPIDIDVNIGGTLRTPTLALASGGAANVPQSELLSFLFFGQPSFALGGGGLAGEALGGFGELLGIGLGNTLGEAGLPVDVFQLRLTGFGGLGANTAMLVVGSEITDDVFLTVESYLNALFGESQSGLDAWAIRLEWAFARRSSLSTGFEPVNSALLLRGARLDRSSAPGQQLFVELRRRWLW